MRTLRALFIRLGGLFQRGFREREMAAEFESHLQIHIDDNLRRGMAPEQARREARLTFGAMEAIKDTYRETFGIPGIETLIQDFRFGLRMLGRSPIWTTVVAGTLALGVGLTTAIFSMVYGVLLQPLPYPQPDRLVALWTSSSDPRSLSKFNVIGANYLDWRSQSKLFEDIALVRPIANFNLTGDGPPERLQGARTSANLLHVLGVQPALGRSFTEEETASDARVAVLSDGLWVRRFGRDPGIVGRRIQLNGAAWEIIGVMPRDYRFPSREFELWTPLLVPRDELQERAAGQYNAVGRLKPGVSLQQAQAEISSIMQGLARQYPANRDLGALVEPLHEGLVRDVRQALYVLLAASGCLLLIGCMNLSILLIGRASARAREMSVRAALGASAGRLHRQILAEVLPLSLAGVAGGLLLALVLLKAVEPWLPPTMPLIDTIGLHWPALLFCAAASLIVVLLAGVLPARAASRIQLAQALQQESRAVAGRGGIRNTLVVAQVAVTVVLLFGGGLLSRSLVALLRVNPGFVSDGVLTMHLAVTRAQYPQDAQVAQYYDRLIARIRGIAGVEAAGVVNRLPLSGIGQINPIQLEGHPELGNFSTDTRSITPGYFEAMGIPILNGRGFTDGDREDRPLASIIDEPLARRLFGSGDPLGKRIRIGFGNIAAPWTQIVGVAGHIRNDTPEADSRPQVYFPESRRAQDRGALVVRTRGDPARFTSAVVQQIRAENPEQAVYDVRTMRDWMGRTLQSRNLLTGLISLFSGAALLLACLGLYGVVSYTAGLRWREFGIRMALGSRPSQILSVVLSHAGKLVFAGALVGLALTWPASRAVKSLLFGVESTDWISLAAPPALLFAVALLAALGPARKSAKVDPMAALRWE